MRRVFGCIIIIQDIGRRSRQHDYAVCKGLEEMGLAEEKQERKQSLQSINIHTVFSARHACYSALYAIARPSVCPPVCLSHGWISQRRLKLGSRILHHRVAP